MLSGLASAALFLLLSGWVIYPLALLLLPRRARNLACEQGDQSAPITVVIATRESPTIVSARVASLYSTTWPHDRLRVVVGVDCKAPEGVDDHAELLSGYPNVQLVQGDSPGGKAATLNAAMRVAKTDIVVFADSAQEFKPEAIGELFRTLAPPDVGGVTGQIATTAERGVFRLFWRYETGLRRLESKWGIVVAVTGAIYAMKRRYWHPLPPGLICDDLLIPLQLGRNGMRVEVATGAWALDDRRFTREAQLSRKVRTLTGMIQVCVWQPWVLVPWSHRLWAAFLCHKLLRILTPLLLLLMIAAVGLSVSPAVLLTGVAVVGATLLLLAAPGLRWSFLEEGRWVVRLLIAPLVAFSRALRGEWNRW